MLMAPCDCGKAHRKWYQNKFEPCWPVVNFLLLVAINFPWPLATDLLQADKQNLCKIGGATILGKINK